MPTAGAVKAAPFWGTGGWIAGRIVSPRAPGALAAWGGSWTCGDLPPDRGEIGTQTVQDLHQVTSFIRRRSNLFCRWEA